MKAILKYSLYRRLQPTNEVKANSFLPGGSVIDVEEIVEGKPIDGFSDWCKASDGFYYWGRGVNLYSEADGFDYKSIISFLPKDKLDTNGRTGVIAIVDTGVSINKLFFNEKLLSEISLADLPSANKDHGTFVCGMMAGFRNCIKGIAFESRIVSFRYKDENTILEKAFDNLSESLQKLKELSPAFPGKQIILNISQGFNNFQTSKFPDKVQKITSLITELANSGVLICCAAGENNQLIEGDLLFPALLPDVISVGCITEDFKSSVFSDKISIVTSLQTYKSYDTNFNIISDLGSSFSVAIISSIASLFGGHADTSAAKKNFLSALKPFSIRTTAFNFQNNSYQLSIQN